MTHELIYTSAPKGLKPGSRGFSTVAQTRHTPGVLAESLEALSGYKFAFPMGSSQERLNPVAYSHFILSSGGIAHHVLSRVSAAPPDYTGRSNKLAHHLVLTPAEAAQLPCGPAALMKQPDFFKTSWSGEPHWIEAPRSLKACEATTSVCSQWKKTTGDAGWAGKLAEQWQSNFSSPLILVFPEGLDVLPLVEESLSLLPPADRWRLTFSTYFTSLPAGVRECSLRCILAGSEEHQKSLAQVGNRIVDLTKALPSLETSSLVDDARNGTRLTKPSTIPQIPKTSKPPAIKSVPTNEPPPPVRVEVVEDATWEPPDTSGPPTRTGSSRRNRRSRGRWAYPLIAAITALLLLAVGSFFLILRQSSTTIATTDKQSESDVESTPKPDPEPTRKANAPDQPSKDPLESQPQEKPPGVTQPKDDAKQPDGDQPLPTTDEKESTAPLGKDMPDSPKPSKSSMSDKAESEKSLDGTTDSPNAAAPESSKHAAIQQDRAPENKPSEPQIIKLIDKSFLDGVYKKTEASKPFYEFPEDYIFIARKKTNRQKPVITLQKDDKIVLTFDSTPVIQLPSSQETVPLRTIKLQFEPNSPSSIIINGDSNNRLQIPFSKESLWKELLSAWKEQHPSCFPKSRQDPSKDAITNFPAETMSPDTTLGDDYIVMTTFKDDDNHKFEVDRKDPKTDVVKVFEPEKTQLDGYKYLGKFHIERTEERVRIEWKQIGEVNAFNNIKKKNLKSLFFIIADNEALPCHSPRSEERIKLNTNHLKKEISKWMDNKDNKAETFDLTVKIIGNDSIDFPYESADSWKVRDPKTFDVKSLEVNSPEERVRLSISTAETIDNKKKHECFLTVSVPSSGSLITVKLEQIPGKRDDEKKDHECKIYRDALIAVLLNFEPVTVDVFYEHYIGSQLSKIKIGEFIIQNN